MDLKKILDDLPPDLMSKIADSLRDQMVESALDGMRQQAEKHGQLAEFNAVPESVIQVLRAGIQTGISECMKMVGPTLTDARRYLEERDAREQAD